MREYFNMVCGFISYGQKFLCFCCRTTDFWFSLEQMSQLPGCICSVGQHACSVGQLMCSVGQNRCFSWPRYIFSVLANMHVQLARKHVFICTYTTGFLKCSLTNIQYTWGTTHVLVLASMHAELPEYRFSWLGCMFQLHIYEFFVAHIFWTVNLFICKQ